MNVAEIDNHNWAVEEKEHRERMAAVRDTNWFRGIPLPPAGERQQLKGLMREVRKAKRREAEARNADTREQRRAAWRRANPEKARSARKMNRDARRLQAKWLADHPAFSDQVAILEQQGEFLVEG